jgi:hypothetical protein
LKAFDDAIDGGVMNVQDLLDGARTAPTPDIENDEVTYPDSRLATALEALKKALLDEVAGARENESHGNSSWGLVGLGVGGDSHFLFPVRKKALHLFSAAESRTVI